MQAKNRTDVPLTDNYDCDSIYQSAKAKTDVPLAENDY